MNNKDLIALSDKYIMGTYKRFPVVLTKGQGTKVWDSDGKEYLDFVAGIAVCSLGHSNPKVVAAIKDQANTLTHVSNLYYIGAQIKYASLLVPKTFGDKVFFCNSGAEANEAAIKLARKYGNENMSVKRNEIITMKSSFHGRTLATITATGQEKFQKGFEPLPEGFRYIPFNDLDSLKTAITDKTCAVMLEPIQVEGGIRVPDNEYLAGVRKICDDHDLLMILDEVQVGMGRTGRLFAYEHDSVKPDIMTLAKAIGNGFPMGAMVATDRVASIFEPGSHASTFGGNPLAMSAAYAVLEIMLEEGFLENVERVGRYFKDHLTELQAKHGMIVDVRGKGLILGVEMDREVAGIIRECLDRGLLVASAGPNVLRFVPPLTVTENEIDQALQILDGILEEQ
ncbi:MAG: Acetylornithine aminotransferase [Syntrophus sp. SKADARSKE-3]|nr:Acetylornithine aminotransferase [Syntrophus sp. SKADARSKE-3]